ncbi:hypothetical protein D3C86_1666740 [compost metagenome]
MNSQTPMADMLNASDPAAPDSDSELLASLITGLTQLLAEATVEVELAEKRVMGLAVDEAMTQKASGPHTLQ